MTIEERIEQALETARPYLRADGGDVRLLRFKSEGVAEVQWVGTCQRCPLSVLTLRAGVERLIMRDVPEVRRVEAVTG
jgi:Fe-S cluster biogenesis protein NfuA